MSTSVREYRVRCTRTNTGVLLTYGKGSLKYVWPLTKRERGKWSLEDGRVFDSLKEGKVAFEEVAKRVYGKPKPKVEPLKAMKREGKPFLDDLLKDIKADDLEELEARDPAAYPKVEVVDALPKTETYERVVPGSEDNALDVLELLVQNAHNNRKDLTQTPWVFAVRCLIAAGRQSAVPSGVGQPLTPEA